jgi:hypothetical protein
VASSPSTANECLADSRHGATTPRRSFERLCHKNLASFTFTISNQVRSPQPRERAMSLPMLRREQGLPLNCRVNGSLRDWSKTPSCSFPALLQSDIYQIHALVLRSSRNPNAPVLPHHPRSLPASQTFPLIRSNASTLQLGIAAAQPLAPRTPLTTAYAKTVATPLAWRQTV